MKKLILLSIPAFLLLAWLFSPSEQKKDTSISEKTLIAQTEARASESRANAQLIMALGNQAFYAFLFACGCVCVVVCLLCICHFLNVNAEREERRYERRLKQLSGATYSPTYRQISTDKCLINFDDR